MDRIELKVYKPKAKEERRLCRATGLSNGYIVSQMIIQGEKLVDIVEVTE